jgi:hypothetical protein
LKLESDEDEGQQEAPVELQLQLVIDSNFSVRRMTGGLLPASVPANDSTNNLELVYLLSTASDPARWCCLSWRAQMASLQKCSRQYCLCSFARVVAAVAEVVDFDKPGSVQAWRKRRNSGERLAHFRESREAQGGGGDVLGDAASSGSEKGIQPPMSKLACKCGSECS